MKAIEIISRTDDSGNLKIDYKLGEPGKKVRIFILLQDEFSEDDDEKLWVKSISNNPVFNFLNEPEEDIYSLNDGQPLND